MALVVPVPGGSTDPYAHERKVADATLTRWERVYEADLQRTFARQKKVTLAKLNSRKSFALARKAGITAASIYDNEKWRAQMYDDAYAMTTDIVDEIGTATFDAVVSGNTPTKAAAVSFDLTDPKVNDLITTRANYVAGASDTTYASIQSELAAGQEEGEGIDKLAFRVESIFDDASEWRARTIARTEVVSATNGASFLGAGQTGQVSGKSWLATPDDRTRIAHVLIDGETVGLDEEFSNGLQYPGDPDGEPEEVINCRCTVLFDAEPSEEFPQHPPEDTPAVPERAPRAPTRTPTAPEPAPAPTPPEPVREAPTALAGEPRAGVPSVQDLAQSLVDKPVGGYTELDGPAIEDTLVRVEATEAPMTYGANPEPAVELRFKLTEEGKAFLSDQANVTEHNVPNDLGWQTRADAVIPKKIDGAVNLNEAAWQDVHATANYTAVNEQPWGMVRSVHTSTESGYAWDGTTTVWIRAADFSEQTVADAMDLLGMNPAYPTEQELRTLAENKITTLFADGGRFADAASRADALIDAERYGITPDSLVRYVDKATGRVEFRIPEEAARKIVEDTKAEVFFHRWGGGNDDLISMLTDDRQALMSTTSRWSEGIGRSGMSSGADVESGGAQYVFTRQSTIYDSTYNSGYQLIFDGEKSLTRTDWFAYREDSYGVTKPGSRIERNNNLASLRDGVAQRSSQETMFKDRMSLDDLKWLQVDDEAAKSYVLRRLDEAGVDELGGRPVDEMVLTRAEVRARIGNVPDPPVREPAAVATPKPAPKPASNVLTEHTTDDGIVVKVLGPALDGDPSPFDGVTTAYEFHDNAFVTVQKTGQVFVKAPGSKTMYVKTELPVQFVKVDFNEGYVFLDHEGGYQSVYDLTKGEFKDYQVYEPF